MTKNKGQLLAAWIIKTSYILAIFGLLAILSSATLKGHELIGDPYYFIKKQAFAIFLGSLIIWITQKMPLVWLDRLPLPMLCVSLLILTAVFIPGAYHKVGGAYRWIKIGGLKYQSSELAKLALIFFLAKNLSRPNYDYQNFFKGVLPNLLIISSFVLLLLKQPDFGSGILLLAISFSLLFVSGLKRSVLLGLGFSALLTVIIGILMAPYRIKRFISFLDPWAHAQSSGFQIIQSYVAFQNGSFFGSGLGESKQKLFFLPEAHTDFIFSVLAEELGLIGSLFVLLCLCYLLILGYRVSLQQKKPFYFYLAFGLVSLLAYQSLFNLSVVMGLLPTKGLSLPFMSYGSSSLLTCFTCTGILARLAKTNK